jgi:hypothetical protein
MQKDSVRMLVRSAGLGLALAGSALGLANAQPSVGVSIGINQPGVYGRINIGNYPPPPLVYAQPVVIMPGPVAVQRAPIYLYVPPAQQRGWSRYCGRYGACGQPVYFVQERWVRERYEHERAQAQRGHDNGRHKGWDKRRDDDGPGRGRGHDKHGKHGE